MAKKRVFSGVKPSGDLHIGNYLGAIKNWVPLQKTHETIFCIVDLHAITVPQEPKTMHRRTREIAALYIASGVDPKKSTIFVQSDVLEHAELAWILNSIASFGELKRMTQFKEKGEKQSFVSAGLLTYPTLMAADVLLYDTELVPVGEDQKQHVELARDIAERFNHRFGKTFTVPKPLINMGTARIMALDSPTNKMAKSDESPHGAIEMLDSNEEIENKIRRAVTDSGSEIAFNLQRPAINNLLNIYQAFSEQSKEEIEKHFIGRGYGEFKEELAKLIIEKLGPIRDEAIKLMKDEKKLDKILADGAGKAGKLATQKMDRVKEKMGLG